MPHRVGDQASDDRPLGLRGQRAHLSNGITAVADHDGVGESGQRGDKLVAQGRGHVDALDRHAGLPRVAEGTPEQGLRVPNADAHPVQSVQSVHGMFGDDLFFSIVEYRTPAGSAPLGYLFEGGEFRGVEKARFRTETDSGAPRRCDLLVATADRRDFRIPGAVTSEARNGPGFATFDLGRRRGTGLLELHDQR